MRDRFQLDRHNATATSELMAGLASFLAISYILAINPLIFMEVGVPFAATFAATALSAGLCTLFAGLYANVPFTMAPAMSLNALIANTLCLRLGFRWQEAFCVSFFSGLIHVLLMFGPAARISVRNFIPESLKYAATVGIGIFVTIGGIHYSGLLTHTSGTADNVAFDISSHADGLTPIIQKFSHSNFVAILGILVIVALMALEVRNRTSYGAIPLGILVATFVGIPLGVTSVSALYDFELWSFLEIGKIAFAIFGDPGLLSLLAEPSRLLLGVFFCFVVTLSHVSDSIITVLGLGRMGPEPVFGKDELEAFYSRDGGSTRIDRAYRANAVGAVAGGLLGTSPSTMYIESSLALVSGGRTGLTALTSGGLFLASIPLAGILYILPAEAVGSALILAGIFPMSLVRRVNWLDIEESVPCGLAILLMVATNNFLAGMSLGMTSHLVVQAAMGKVRDMPRLTLAAAACFCLATVLLHFLQY